QFPVFFLIDAVSELVGAGPDYGRWGSGLLLLPRSQVPGYGGSRSPSSKKDGGQQFPVFFLIDAVSELVGAGPDYGRSGSGLLLLPRSQVPGYGGSRSPSFKKDVRQQFPGFFLIGCSKRARRGRPRLWPLG